MRDSIQINIIITGNFWPTRERFLINAPMTRSFTVDNFYLVSPIIRKDQVGYAEVSKTDMFKIQQG